MKIRRAFAGILIAGTASIGLTACDPPMPPDVAAQLAEEFYTCVEGDVGVSSEELMNDVVFGWSDSLSFSCVDPEPTMTFSLLESSDESAMAQISANAPTCSPVESVPLGVDAAVIVYTQSELGALSLSPKSIAGLLSGSITNWKDLAADNPGYEMPDMPIEFISEADQNAVSSLISFLELSGEQADASSLVVTSQESPSLDLYSSIPEGTMAVVPSSYAVYLGLTPASIYLGFDDELQESIVANADLAGIQSGTTQWKYSDSATGVSVTLDPTVEPVPADGFDTADVPYQAIYPVNFYLCSPDQLITRAIARFMLRLDSQGALGGSYYAPLPEAIRIASLVKISNGLPTPTPVD
jgi:hypothetical protein